MSKLDRSDASVEQLKSASELLAEAGLRFEDYYPIPDIPPDVKKDLIHDIVTEKVLNDLVEEDKHEAQRIKEYVAAFFLAHREDIKQFLNFAEFPPDVPVCFVPATLHQYDSKKMEGEYNGRYDPKTRRAYVYVLRRKSDTVKTDIDLVRVALHEYLHAVSHEPGRKLGFSQSEIPEEFNAFDETMTEYATRKFFRLYHKGKQPHFNSELLSDAAFIDAMQEIVGWKCVLDAYLHQQGLTTLLDRLSAAHIQNVAFNRELLESIYAVLGNKLSKNMMVQVLIGKPVSIKKSSLYDFQHIDLLALAEKLPNVRVVK